MWPVNSIDPELAMTAAAEAYAFYAALVSISLILVSIAVFLLVLDDARSCAFAAMTLCVHPVWTVTQTWRDNGATLRLASTIWVFIGCVAVSFALFSVYRTWGKKRKQWKLRMTSRFLLMITVVVAIILVLSRPPLSDEIPVSRSLPAFGLMLMLIIALHPEEARHRSKRSMRVEVPVQPDLDGNQAKAICRKL